MKTIINDFSKEKLFINVSLRENVDKLVPQQRLRYHALNFGNFLSFNPEYVQEGFVQLAISATKDLGLIEIGIRDQCVSDFLVSKNPMRGTDYYVASLWEARAANSFSKLHRCLCAETYYISVDGEEVHLDRLLNNNDWLHGDRIDEAFLYAINKREGKITEASSWCKFSYRHITDFGRVCGYENKKGERKVLLCMINSGTIIPDIPEEDIKIKKISAATQQKTFRNEALNFKFDNSNRIMRLL